MKRMLVLALVLPALFVGIAYSGDEENGDKAPTFVLKDTAGKTHDLAKLTDKTVVLEWTNPECPVVGGHYKKGTMKKLAEEYTKKGVVWLAVNSTATGKPEASEKWRKMHSLSYPILMDNSGSRPPAPRLNQKSPRLYIAAPSLRSLMRSSSRRPPPESGR